MRQPLGLARARPSRQSGGVITFRVATSADLDAMTETLQLAFSSDPVWAPALARSDGGTAHIRPMWRAYVEASFGYGTAWVADNSAAVALWTPPGEPEMPEETEALVLELLQNGLEPASFDAILELFDRFEQAHPHEPHAYLGILGTHPDFRGRGIAQQLVAENLRTLDEEATPAYLESTNPANDHRYERLGFVKVGGFGSVLDDAPITTMWHAPR